MEIPKVYHSANAIKSGQLLKVIFGSTAVSMAFMFIFIIMQLPILLTVGLFLIIIFICIYSFTYKGEYWIDNEKLEEKLSPKLKFMPFAKPQHNFYNWYDLETYLQDSNMTRYSGEQHYLKLVFKNPKRVVNINEGNDGESKASFNTFITHFNSLLADEEEASNSTTNSTQTISTERDNSFTKTDKSIEKPIKAKAEKSFYSGVWGKILAVVFLLISSVFLAIDLFPEAFGGIEIKGANKWRLWAILIPGTIYFVNRAFFKKSS